MSYSFGYKGLRGPKHWGSITEDWKLADYGKRQSPIDILTADVLYDNNLKDIKFEWFEDEGVHLENDGKCPTYHVTPGTHFVEGGPLKARYELVQFHYHFSCDQDKGSEHAVNGRFYQAEAHFVHFNTNYGTLKDALKHHDGLAVIGVFIDVDENGNISETLEKDLQALSQVATVGARVKKAVHLSRYRFQSQRYYTYEGSLTTPGCYECVVWIVLRDHLAITPKSFNTLASLQSHEGGLISEPGNMRPPQPLHGRTVLANFQQDEKIIKNLQTNMYAMTLGTRID